MATNFEPTKCVIFVQFTKIGTPENKGIHSIFEKDTYQPYFRDISESLS